MLQFSKKLQFLNKLLYLSKEHHKSLIATTSLFILTSGLEVFGTGMVGPFISIATTPNFQKNNPWLNSIYQQLNFNSEKQFVVFLGLLVIGIFFVKAFVSFSAQKTVFQFGYLLKGEMSYKLMKAYLEAPYSYHLRINSAALIQDIHTTTDIVCLGVFLPFLTSISNSVIILALILLLIKTSAMALILIGMLLPIVILLLKSMKSKLAIWSKDGWEATGEIIRIMNHALGGLKETRVIGCEPYFEHQMELQTDKLAVNCGLWKGYANLPRYALEAFMITFLIGFTLLFLSLDREGQNLTAILGIFSLASIRLIPAVGNLLTGVNSVSANVYAVEKLFFDFKELEQQKLLPGFNSHRRAASLVSSPEKFKLPFSKHIVLDSIAFQYPNTTKNAIEEISLKIYKGQSIGLIGKSGSGKTTLVDVFLGLFLPQSGDIKVDAISVYSNLREWQNMLGYVPQSIFLIDDTLERNIAFGVPDEEIDQYRLRKAIEMAQLSEVVDQLPEGIKTMVGERGVLLSGGQRQRVGIARVLYHEREILVFDEATAALDTETENLVTEATKALSRKKTIIIIAHRLSTIEHCDRIYELERGRILKSGSYQEVVGKLPKNT